MSGEPTLGSFLEALSKAGRVRKLGSPLSPKFEMAAAESLLDGGPAVVAKAKGSDIPVVFNLLNTRAKYALALGVQERSAPDALFRAAASATAPGEVEGAIGKGTLPDLDSLPIVTHFERDSGAYATSSMVMTINEQTHTQNLSVHRLLKVGKRKLAIRMVEGRHLHRAYTLARDAGRDLPVAIVIGAHPALEIAASFQADYGVDELAIANSILNDRLKVTALPNGVRVPIGSEIVLSGRVLADEFAEDCMVEMLGNYDAKRKQPVVEVERMYVRKGAFFRDILPGGREHRLLMSFAVEVKLNRAVRSVVPSTKRVHLTDGGSNWLHAVIQMKKRLQGEPKNAMLAAFAAHPSLKNVIVVDEDIDPEDPLSVEYALATRFQASKGLVIISGAKGSSLDPSSDQSLLLTDKMGMDATASLEKDPEMFERGSIPGKEEVSKRLGRKR